MEHPVCLIENHEDGTIQVNKEALKILSSITQKVVVVAIVGKYCTGKSYLMNKLAGRNNGFPLGSTVQSTTKGIWMWCVPHPVKRHHTLVLLDTEGLGDVEKGNSENDSWIFPLSVLLCSTLVFNSVGTINQEAMDQLHYVTELTEKIKIKSAQQENDMYDDSSEFKRTFPSFIWCVRDFILQLTLDGQEITEDEYLNNALKLKPGLNKASHTYNLPRECIRHYFHSHKCFVFDRPASKKHLQNLDNVHESELDPEFVEQTKKFCEYIYEMSPVKTLSGGFTVTGRGLGEIAVSYIELIRSGTIPLLENAVLALSKMENTRALEEALSKYEEVMSQHARQFPTETHEGFRNLDKEAHSEALKVFMELCFKDENQEYQSKLVKEIENKKAFYVQHNEETSVRKCRELLQGLRAGLDKSISDGKFSVPGGYRLLNDEKKALEIAYLRAEGKGVKYMEVLQNFLKEIQNTESTILAADRTLKEKEKQLAEERSQAKAAAREKEIQEKANMELKEILETNQEKIKMHKEMLEKKLNEEREKMKKENEWIIQEKLKIEANPAEGFNNRHVKAEIWARISRTLYPEWDELDAKKQDQILKDTKNLWRSIHFYRKQENEAERSGSSPQRQKIAYSDQLQCLHTNQVLRQSSGNIPQQAEEGSNLGDTQMSSASSADPDLSLDQEQHVLPSTSSTSVGEGEPHQQSQRVGNARRGARRAQVNMSPHTSVVNETLAMIQRVDGEDHWDHMAYAIAARLREMQISRQWSCVSAIFQVMELYASSEALPANIEMINLIHGLRRMRSVVETNVRHNVLPNENSNVQAT